MKYILRDVIASARAHHGDWGKEISVIVDYPFISGRATANSFTTGRKLADVLENGLRRYGW
jgi:hypothetical protein